MNLQDIQNLIGQGDTGGAIRALAGLAQEGAGRNKRLRNDLLILSNRYEELRRKETIGLLEQDDAVREHTLVNSALLNLIEELEAKNPLQDELAPAAPVREINKNLIWQAISLIILITLGVLIYLAYPKRTQPETAPAPKEQVAPLTAAFHWVCTPANCEAPCSVDFVNDSKSAVRFDWNFGDGHGSTSENPTHRYENTGVFTVSMTAINGLERQSIKQTIQILPKRVGPTHR